MNIPLTKYSTMHDRGYLGMAIGTLVIDFSNANALPQQVPSRKGKKGKGRESDWDQMYWEIFVCRADLFEAVFAQAYNIKSCL